jgi:hypothetical protein
MDEKNNNRSVTVADLNALEERLAGRIEHVETTLLTEFHKWGQTYEIRSRGVTTLVYTFEERLGVLEERVSALERRRR